MLRFLIPLFLICLPSLIISHDLPNTTVRIIPSGADYPVSGRVLLKKCANGVIFEGFVTGLSPGRHGFHIHEKGSLGNGCKAAGGHFNPRQTNHGSPASNERHGGDLGNILADEKGEARFNFFTEQTSLDPFTDSYIGGRAIVIHAKPDDLGDGGDAESLKTGNAGARVGCGLIHKIEDGNLRTQQNSLTICEPRTAVANIIPGNSDIYGQLRLTESGAGVTISGVIRGLTPGQHGFHIHMNGDTGNACSNAGGHFNPFQKTHGSPVSKERHVGDLGNIEVDEDGVASLNIYDEFASLFPQSLAYVGGRAFVVHALPDDLGRGRNEESLKTGNAGSRDGCGIITARERTYTAREKSGLPPIEETSQMRVDNFDQTHENIVDSIPHFNPSILHQNYNPSASDFDTNTLEAVVPLISVQPNQIQGVLSIKQRGFGVFIEGQITGLTPGLHGFHIHETGSTGNDCKDAGPHFNPYNKDHGHPNGYNRHVGDLGNIIADSHGIANIAIYDSHATLDSSSEANIIGRAIVIHAGEDDLGRARNAESLKTGNAGGRISCGVIKNTIDIPLQQSRSELPPLDNARSSYGGRPAEAEVLIFGTSESDVSGSLSVTESPNGVFIRGKIFGLNPGLHGFHIHQEGSITNNCVDAGPHFNPFQRDHGSPSNLERHVGDLGNIFADQTGTANILIYDNLASLDPESESNIIGRSFVVHEKPDDLGRGGNEESLKTGNAGRRLGCGTIELSSISQAMGFYHFSSGSFYPRFNEADAIVDIISASEHGTVSGTLEMRILDDHSIGITGTITGLTPGKHGFHVHEKGDLGNACKNAGGHFNPFQQLHGDPRSTTRHVGDLGNIIADNNGRAILHITDSHISLDPNEENYIGGLSIVVHEKEDDLGRGRDDGSLKTGNAGSRLACGLVNDGFRTSTLKKENQQIQLKFPAH